MTYCSSPRRWKNYVKCSASSRPAQKRWVWASTRIKRRYLPTRTEQRQKEITVDNIKIEVLANGDNARYLGQKIKFEEEETEEIKNRLKAAWAVFHKYRQELTSKDYRLCHRLRLFNKVITPTMTYASGTWTLTQKHEKMIKTAQRKMLRLIVQTKRKYKSIKVTANKKMRASEKRMKKTKRARLTKKQKRAQNKAHRKIQTVTYLLRKRSMKKLMPLKMKKTGSNTSKEAPKRLKNKWKNKNPLLY